MAKIETRRKFDRLLWLFFILSIILLSGGAYVASSELAVPFVYLTFGLGVFFLPFPASALAYLLALGIPFFALKRFRIAGLILSLLCGVFLAIGPRYISLQQAKIIAATLKKSNVAIIFQALAPLGVTAPRRIELKYGVNAPLEPEACAALCRAALLLEKADWVRVVRPDWRGGTAFFILGRDAACVVSELPNGSDMRCVIPAPDLHAPADLLIEQDAVMLPPPTSKSFLPWFFNPRFIRGETVSAHLVDSTISGPPFLLYSKTEATFWIIRQPFLLQAQINNAKSTQGYAVMYEPEQHTINKNSLADVFYEIGYFDDPAALEKQFADKSVLVEKNTGGGEESDAGFAPPSASETNRAAAILNRSFKTPYARSDMDFINCWIEKSRWSETYSPAAIEIARKIINEPRLKYLPYLDQILSTPEVASALMPDMLKLCASHPHAASHDMSAELDTTDAIRAALKQMPDAVLKLHKDSILDMLAHGGSCVSDKMSSDAIKKKL